MNLHEEMVKMGDRAVVASRALAQLSAKRKNAILEAMAVELEARRAPSRKPTPRTWPPARPPASPAPCWTACSSATPASTA
jgi:hypothetical protein